MSEPHILVVDDHREIREPLSSYLRKHGMRVSQAANAAAAREAVVKQAIDLIVLDVMMPGEDGLSLCRYVREAHGRSWLSVHPVNEGKLGFRLAVLSTGAIGAQLRRGGEIP